MSKFTQAVRHAHQANPKPFRKSTLYDVIKSNVCNEAENMNHQNKDLNVLADFRAQTQSMSSWAETRRESREL